MNIDSSNLQSDTVEELEEHNQKLAARVDWYARELMSMERRYITALETLIELKKDGSEKASAAIAMIL